MYEKVRRPMSLFILLCRSLMPSNEVTSKLKPDVQCRWKMQLLDNESEAAGA